MLIHSFGARVPLEDTNSNYFSELNLKNIEENKVLSKKRKAKEIEIKTQTKKRKILPQPKMQELNENEVIEKIFIGENQNNLNESASFGEDKKKNHTNYSNLLISSSKLKEIEKKYMNSIEQLVHDEIVLFYKKNNNNDGYIETIDNQLWHLILNRLNTTFRPVLNGTNEEKKDGEEAIQKEDNNQKRNTKTKNSFNNKDKNKKKTKEREKANREERVQNLFRRLIAPHNTKKYQTQLVEWRNRLLDLKSLNDPEHYKKESKEFFKVKGGKNGLKDLPTWFRRYPDANTLQNKIERRENKMKKKQQQHQQAKDKVKENKDIKLETLSDKEHSESTVKKLLGFKKVNNNPLNSNMDIQEKNDHTNNKKSKLTKPPSPIDLTTTSVDYQTKRNNELEVMGSSLSNISVSHQQKNISFFFSQQKNNNTKLNKTQDQGEHQENETELYANIGLQLEQFFQKKEKMDRSSCCEDMKQRTSLLNDQILVSLGENDFKQVSNLVRTGLKEINKWVQKEKDTEKQGKTYRPMFKKFLRRLSGWHTTNTPNEEFLHLRDRLFQKENEIDQKSYQEELMKEYNIIYCSKKEVTKMKHSNRIPLFLQAFPSLSVLKMALEALKPKLPPLAQIDNLSEVLDGNETQINNENKTVKLLETKKEQDSSKNSILSLNNERGITELGEKNRDKRK